MGLTSTWNLPLDKAFTFVLKTEKKKFKKSEITMEVGGWVRVSPEFFFGKSSQNSPKPVLIFCSSIPCVFCLYIHRQKLLVIMI